jgi:hypothetical protein
MEKSLEVIKTIKFEYLFPGHDYWITYSTDQIV